MEYTIVEEDDRENLVAVVREYMEDGWEPQGGVSITGVYHGSTAHIYAQALIRRSK